MFKFIDIQISEFWNLKFDNVIKCLAMKQEMQQAVAQTRSVKKASLEISQNLQKNACARASILIKLQAK